MVCPFCQSEWLYLQETEGKTGLYCKSCRRWIRWVPSEERDRVERELNRQRREIRIDGADVDRVMEKYRDYLRKYRALSEDISSTQSIVAKSGSAIDKSALYSKALHLKELGIRVETCEQLFRALGLKTPL